MEYVEYINYKKQIYDLVIQYLANENHSEEYFQLLIKHISNQRYQNNKAEFKLVLLLINKVSMNFHRNLLFLEKIKHFFSYYDEYIKLTYSNSEIFNIFKNNKRILFILFEMKILTINQSITDLMLKKIYDLEKFYLRLKGNYGEINHEHILEKRLEYVNFICYFLPEINPFLSEIERSLFEREMPKQGEFFSDDFEINRRNGENESYICQLIRQDLIDEFVTIVNKTNLSLSIQINPTIFETNRFLSKRKSTLIEYAAFFGSIQIFQYLRLNGVQLSPSLWLYAIHGKNPEIIHFLEQEQIMPEDESYMNCLKESIKCHHNDIANYINDNLIHQNISSNEDNYKYNSVAFGFQYHNYEFIKVNPSNFQYILFYASMYDYLTIVKFLIISQKVNINETIILNIIFFLYKDWLAEGI